MDFCDQTGDIFINPPKELWLHNQIRKTRNIVF